MGTVGVKIRGMVLNQHSDQVIRLVKENGLGTVNCYKAFVFLYVDKARAGSMPWLKDFKGSMLKVNFYPNSQIHADIEIQ